VSDLINSQKILAENGQALIEEANKLINRLSA
jgi:hypothetical protein